MTHIAGGIIYDSTIHDLDMSLWLAGSQPESVYVSASAFDPDIASCGDYDQVVVTIKFKNGVVSSVENGRVAAYGYDQRLEVCEWAVISEGKTLIYMYMYYDKHIMATASFRGNVFLCFILYGNNINLFSLV